jgi:RNA polymerase sigma-70 factor (ECF subfamily)
VTSDTLRLLADARGGDGRAVDLLLERHRGRLAAFVASRMPAALRDHVEPDDVVQETCLEASRKIHEFVPEHRRAFYAWLVRIAGFKLKEADRRRRAKKRGNPAPLEIDPAAIQTSVASRVGRADRARRVAEALEAIPPQQAEAVRLRYLQGLSVKDTAAALDTSPAAVKALVARGLEQLAARLRTTA